MGPDGIVYEPSICENQTTTLRAYERYFSGASLDFVEDMDLLNTLFAMQQMHKMSGFCLPTFG